MSEGTITTEPFPIGSRWKHRNVDYPVTVTGVPFESEGQTHYPVTNDHTDQPEGIGWIKRALELSERLDDSTTLSGPTPDEIIEGLRAECEGLRDTVNLRERTLAEVRSHLAQREEFITNLGEALCDEALKREWCSEYDEFAEQWDLPKRYLNYEVTMTVTVTAANEESALEMVRESVSINSYSENVTDGPSFDAGEE